MANILGIRIRSRNAITGVKSRENRSARASGTKTTLARYKEAITTTATRRPNEPEFLEAAMGWV
jgi:hypothetical protein